MSVKRDPRLGSFRRWVLSTLFYESTEWKIVRLQALDRAGYRCEHPGCNERENLDGHHILYRRAAPEKALSLDNIVVWCRYHHAVEHPWLIGRTKWSRLEPSNDAQLELPLGDLSR